MTAEVIRPSALPKLQECRCYVATSSTSEAAARGTRLDAAIRAIWQDDERGWDNVESPEECEAVNWALNILRQLACGNEVETREEQLRAVSPLEAVKDGVMDSLCVAGAWLADYKSGQVRDYAAQMAQYALSCMDAYFADEWSSHLIFFDQKVLVSHKWTREEAEQLVLGIVNAPKVETPCDYCGWCGVFETCPAVRTASALVTREELPAPQKNEEFLPPSMDSMLENHAAAHEFLTKLRIVNDWADLLKKKLLSQLEAGTSDHFSRVVVSGSKKVNPLSLARFGKELGYDRMLKICSQVPLSKVQEVWREVFGETPVPEDLIVTSGGSVQLKLKKVKKSLTTNNK